MRDVFPTLVKVCHQNNTRHNGYNGITNPLSPRIMTLSSVNSQENIQNEKNRSRTLSKTRPIVEDYKDTGEEENKVAVVANHGGCHKAPN